MTTNSTSPDGCDLAVDDYYRSPHEWEKALNPSQSSEKLEISNVAPVIAEMPIDTDKAEALPAVSMLEHALALKAKELTLIPLGQEGDRLKRPRIKWQQYQKDDVTEEQIEQWWGQKPSSNIGIVTGKEIVVVDADSPEAEQWARDNLSPTQWEVTTGNGAHFYYCYSPASDSIKNSAGNGLDVRGKGGYVVAPGSIHLSGVRYSWVEKVGFTADYANELPELTAEHLQLIKAYQKTGAAPVSTTSGHQSFGDMRTVPNAPGRPAKKGSRNNELARFAGKLFSKGLSIEEVSEECDEWNDHLEDPLEIEEVLNTVASIEKTHERNQAKVAKAVKEPLESVDAKPRLARRSNTRERRLLATRNFGDIESKQVQWLWRGRIPSKLTILAGNPGCGKSQITIAMAATVSIGGCWPDSTPCEKGSVIFICCEDDASDTIKPRLEAAGADCSKITIVDGVRNEDGTVAGWDLEDGAEYLGDLCGRLGDVRLIVIDPITAYLGGSDGHSTSDVRGLLAPLMSLADKREIAVIAISHLNKNSGGEAIGRITGSGAYVAAARAAFLVGEHPDEEGAYCMATLKANLSKEKTAVGYSVRTVTTKDHIETSRVEWMLGVIDIDADTLMKPKRTPIDMDVQSAKTDAAAFLISMLKDGPVLSTTVYKEADEAGIAEATLKRAKKSIGIRSDKEGSKWYTALPKRLQEDQESPP